MSQLNLPPLPKNEKPILKPTFKYSPSEFAELFKKGQRIFGVPGASLTWGINGVKGMSSVIGINGEEETAKALEEYIAHRPNVYVFHSIMWPTGTGDTDHVIVYKNHAIIIDSKRWKSVRKYSISASGYIMRGTVPFPEGKVRTAGAVNRWREKLKGFKVSAIVCIAQEKVFVVRDRNWYRAPFRLVEIEKLKEQLDNEFDFEKDKGLPDNYSLLSYLGALTVKERDLRSEIIQGTL